MVLKPQDLLILLKILAKAGDAWSYGSLAVELGMSPAEVHSGVKRAIRARLAMPGESGAPARPVLRALEEFVIHGAPYVFIAEHGEISRGVATAWAAPMFGMILPLPVNCHWSGRIRMAKAEGKVLHLFTGPRPMLRCGMSACTSYSRWWTCCGSVGHGNGIWLRSG